METFDLRVFGQRLRERRHALDLSQQALADLMHAPQGWISDLENVRQTHVQADTVYRLCRALDVSADYLLGLVDRPTPVPVRPQAPTPLRQPGIWKGKLPPDWDAHFDDLDEEIIRMFEGEDDDAAPR